MANHHPTARSLVYGLSDFWTLYFKDLPVIEAIYQGVEIDVGQVYLDLLTLLLNNSTQDAALFNKQFFRLIRMREDTVTYGSDGKYGIALGSSVAGVKYLNNKVFAVTSSFEEGIDFVFDTDTRTALFDYDPFDAYKAKTFGYGNGCFTVTSRQPGPYNDLITLELADTGVNPPTLSKSQYALTINYDGPLNTQQTLVRDIVALLNTSSASVGLVRAVLSGLGTGTASIDNTGGPVNLERIPLSPVEGFATRAYDVAFGTRFTVPGVTNWLATDVRKGDVLRITGGVGFGAAQEYPIALVRPESLLLYPQAAPADLTGKLEYAILRSPADDKSIDEAFVPSGFPMTLGAVGNTITASSRRLYVAVTPMPFDVTMVGECIELAGIYNAGEYRIAAVVDANTVVLDGNPLIDETDIAGTVYLTLYDYDVDGQLTDNGDGTSTFTAATAFLPACVVGGVLSIVRGGEVERYQISGWTSNTVVTLATPNGTVSGTGLTFSVSAFRPGANTLFFSPGNGAFPLPGSLTINARRYLDDRQVVEGVDYKINYDLGVVTPISVWRSSITNRCTYRYRNTLRSPIINAISTGVAGTLTAGPDVIFSDPGLSTTGLYPGFALVLSGTDANANDGTYYVKSIVGPTSVKLTSDRVATAPDANNGSLVWAFYERGAVAVTDVIESVTELGMWAVDAQIDKYHLYYTYGYLVERAQTSSEAYRSLIRGLFQLFMLGPTLERFEAAINTVAGLSTIRDDGEILLSYSKQALRSGTSNGSFDGFSRTFTSPTANFVTSDLSSKLYCKTGFNANKLFTIQSIVSPTTAVLIETPTSDTGVSWEVTATGEHSITTSRSTYAYPRTAPLKAKYLDSTNYGVLSLRAFEVVTSAFEVTDYIESPFWWESARIPEALLSGYTPQRRQSTPALFENIVGPGDDGRIGDPGFFVGASDTGVTPSYTTLQSGVGNGAIAGDPLYPTQNVDVFFSAPSAIFTDADLGNLLQVDYPEIGTRYLIVEKMSSTAVRLQAFTPIPAGGVPGLDWAVVNGTLPMRHTAAYVILDHFMKQHLFTVRFDGFLLERLPSNVIQDLQELVFVAKPTYTYMILSPSTLFDDVVRVPDSLSVQSRYQMGGQGGSQVGANDNELLVGSSWAIGSWYRYVSNSSTFGAPAAAVPDVLGVPPANYVYKPHRVWVDPLTFLDTAGVPVPSEDFVVMPFASGTLGSFTATSPTTATFFSNASNTFAPWMNLQYIDIALPAVNAGRYRIGEVVNSQTVTLYAPGAIPEVNLSWTLQSVGYGFDGRTEVDEYGQSFFTDLTGRHDFTTVVGESSIRRPFVTANLQRSWRMDEALSPSIARLATRHTVNTPGVPYVADSVSGADFIAASVVFSSDMAMYDRYLTAPATYLKRIYYIEVTSGPNIGEIRSVYQFFGVDHVQLAGAALIPDTGFSFDLKYLEHYDLVPEGGAWEHTTPGFVVDNEATPAANLVINHADQAAGVASFEAYGVQEPALPLVAVYDDTQGDTYYSVGGRMPYDRWTRPRTGREMDLEEIPLTVKVI